jgi:uncharacterized membrane protein YkvA (DUF1232 family)
MGLADALLTIAGVLVLAWLLLAVVVWIHGPARALAVPALRLIPDLVGLVRSLLADPSSPTRVKVALAGLLVYLVSPIDLIPDFIPVLGSMDDLVITAVVLRWAGRRIGVRQLRAHWAGSEGGFTLLLGLLGLNEERR